MSPTLAARGARTKAMETTVSRITVATALVLLGAVAACSGERPELSDQAPPTATPDPTATAVPTEPPEPTPTATPTPEPPPVVEASSRGITDTTVRIGVVGTTQFFGGMGDGAAARVARTNLLGGIAGRQIEIVDRVDDGGDAATNLSALKDLVETQEVFAVVVVSSAFGPESASYLNEQGVPYVGWGVTGAFCAPSVFGLGFSGCLNGFALGVPDAAPNTAFRAPIEALAGADATLVLVTTDDKAGDAAEVEVAELWGGQLGDVVRADAAQLAAASEDALVPALNAVEAVAPDVVLIRAGFAAAGPLATALRDSGYEGYVVDDVSYVPGVLADPEVAASLEGSYALAAVPPQEELREATQQIVTDLTEIGAAGADPATYQLTLGNSLGYWSTDALLSVVEAAGGSLDTATYVDALREGFRYRPGLDGGPCPATASDLLAGPAGGAAILQVVSGTYQPVVEWTC